MRDQPALHTPCEFCFQTELVILKFAKELPSGSVQQSFCLGSAPQKPSFVIHHNRDTKFPGDDVMAYEHLLFRRQFLITPDRCEALDHWQHKNLGKFNIYAHRDIELSIVDANHEKPSMALIGYMIDPNFPEQTNTDILTNIQNSVDSIDGICEYLYNIAGRFVLVISHPKDTFVFHDACGLRSVFYTKKDKKIYLGSQPPSNFQTSHPSLAR